MTKETERLLYSLNEKVAFVKNELTKLKEENAHLRDELILKQVELDENQIAKSELKRKYEALKIARMLDDGGHNEDLKKHINAMVREIDTCIDLIDG